MNFFEHEFNLEQQFVLWICFGVENSLWFLNMWLFQPRIGVLIVQAISQWLTHFDTATNKFGAENSNAISHVWLSQYEKQTNP